MFQPLKLTAALALRVERTSGRQRAERTGDTGGGKAATKANLEFSSKNLRAECTQRTTRRGGQLGNDDWDNIFMRLYFGRVEGILILSTYDFSNEQVHTYKTIKTQRRKRL